MANSPILGYGVAIHMHDGSSYKPVLCGETCTFNRQVETIEKTSPTSGNFRQYQKRREGWTADVSGLTRIANDASLTFFYMLQTSVRNQEHPLRFVFTDPEGATKQIQGTALITDESITGTAGDFAKASISFLGTGAFVVADVDPPAPVVYEELSDFWDMPAGINYCDLAAVSVEHGYAISAGYILLEVDLEGQGFEIITTGSVGTNRNCKLNTSTFILNFSTDVIAEGFARRVFVFFKRPV